jgi:hypothetical protein
MEWNTSRRIIMAVLTCLCLPSVLAAMPTIALFLDNNEREVGMGSGPVTDLSAAGVHWWFGGLDLMEAVCARATPRGLHTPNEPDPPVTPALLPRILNDPRPLPATPEITPIRGISEMIVLDLVSRPPPSPDTPWTRAAVLPSPGTPPPLAWSRRVFR